MYAYLGTSVLRAAIQASCIARFSGWNCEMRKKDQQREEYRKKARLNIYNFLRDYMYDVLLHKIYSKQ